jgi:hypothetical protein
MSDQPPKRPRRNLDALNNFSTEKKTSNRQLNEESPPINSRRNLNELQEGNQLQNVPPKLNRTRNLGELEENIQFDNKKREERREKLESRGIYESPGMALLFIG